MTARRFILRGLKHYRSSYLGVVLGSALGAMVLLGALFAGDSVKGTLRTVAENRSGTVNRVVVGGENFFRAQLEAEVNDSASVMLLQGQVNADDRVAGQVELFGVTEAFWSFARTPMDAVPLGDREWAINEALSRELGVGEGDALVIRLKRPGFVSRDAPMSGEADALSILRGTIIKVVRDSEMGRFGLAATQLAVPKLFLPIARLQEAVELPGKANLLLLGNEAGEWEGAFQPADYGLSLKEVPPADAVEVRTDRVFLGDRIREKVLEVAPEARGVLTYLATTIAVDEKETPYSMVTGVDPAGVDFLPDDLGPEEAVLNQWIADDLAAEVGDEVVLKYFVMGEGNSLATAERRFTVRAIVPLEGLAADKAWMPDFPGVAEVEDSADWSPGLPLDMERIRDKDEEYWDDYRGAPKVFVTLDAARGMWGNRWGQVTAMRVPTSEAEGLAEKLKAVLVPADGGIVSRDLATEAEKAAKSPVDIAGLFLSMSFFLIVASVALTVMLFRFNVEQRNRESGLLAAVGVPAKRILRWRILEGLVAVVAGSVVGVVLALIYTRGLLIFLESIWNKEGGERFFSFHANPASAIGGIAGFVLIALVAVWLVTRRQARRSASILLEADAEEVVRGRGRWTLWAAVLLAGAGVVALGGKNPQMAFFGAGSAFLGAGLCLFRWALARPAKGDLNRSQLARLNTGRRASRSLVVVGSLAAGVFLVVSVTSFQKHGGDEWRERSSGAGGFAYWVETTGPVNRGDSDGKNPDYFGLGEQRDELGAIVPMRIGAGDDASCFNLNTVSRPRLLAVDPARLDELEAFTIKSAEGVEPRWSSLAGGEVMRAFVDENTLMWVLKMKLGDRVTYQDEWGQPFEVELAGTIPGSIFQGQLLVDERSFLKRYPGAEGYRLFLVDAAGDLGEGKAVIQSALRDRGAQVMTTAERLAAFYGVENTYIAIFNVLGGLGVLLGSAGLGIVTARNLSERRREFALMNTLGISRSAIREVVFREVRQLIGWGLGVGLLAAVVSIIPHLQSQGWEKTVPWVGGLVLAIALNAWFWSWLGFRRNLQAAHESRAEFM